MEAEKETVTKVVHEEVSKKVSVIVSRNLFETETVRNKTEDDVTTAV